MTDIAPGATFTLRHSVTFGGTLQALAATSAGPDGGLGIIAAGVTLTNQGALVAQGGKGGYHKPGTSGGTLVNNGVLQNNASIVVGGGEGTDIKYYGAHGGGGGLLDNSGVLINTGQVTVQGGAGGQNYLSYGAYAGVIDNSGSITNAGTIALQGGYGGFGIDYNKGGPGATLAVSGTLLNTGLLTIGGGGRGEDLSEAGSGALLDISGVATNLGTITAASGQTYYHANPPGGGHIVIGGLFREQGLITLQAASPRYQGKLDISAGGTLLLGGTNAVIATSSPVNDLKGKITNSGAIVGHGLLSDISFINTGVVIANGGLLRIDGDISGGGRFEVAPGATLDLNGTITTHAGLVDFFPTDLHPYLAPSPSAYATSPSHLTASPGQPPAGLLGLASLPFAHPAPHALLSLHLMPA